MAYSGFKGIGPNSLGANKGQAMSSPAKIAPLLAMAGKALVGAIASKAVDSATKMKSPAKQTAKQKKNLPKQIVDAIAAKSPAKMNKGMKYDIKEASNQNLSASARKNYAENAQAASKSGYKG